jgi:hypothetical protein
MPTVSCTAPRFDQKQEEEERAALNEGEKKVIEDEIFGKTVIPTETPEMVARACQELQNALELIPDTQK